MFHVAVADKASINKIISENIVKETRLLSDESRLYGDAPGMFLGHETVKHSVGEYARYDDGFTIHTNTIEGVFSIFKRGMKGVYQHCDEKHFTVIWPSSISATTIARLLAWKTLSALLRPSRVRRASD